MRHPVRRTAEYVGRRIEVVARLPIGRGLVLEGRNRADRHHLAAGVADLQAADVLRCLAELLVRLGKHLVGATEIVEVVHVLRAEVELQCREHVGRGETDFLRLLAVDVGEERRRTGVVEREDAREVGILVGCRDQRVGRSGKFLRRVVAAILDHQLEATGGAQSLDGRRIDDDDDGVLDAGQGRANLRQHRRGVDARNVVAVERRQAVEDRRRHWAR